MQGVGALMLCLAAWLIYSGAHSFRPLTMLRAILSDPKDAAQIIANTTQYVAASKTSFTSSGANGSTGTATAITSRSTLDGASIGPPLSALYQQGDAFGARNGEHKGDDLQVPLGTPVLAATSGIVKYAGLNGTYGNWVLIDNGNGVQTGYAHMESLGVQVGDRVSQGQQIALSGGAPGLATSGKSTGPHLHFEIREAGRQIDPGPYIQQFKKFINS